MVCLLIPRHTLPLPYDTILYFVMEFYVFVSGPTENSVEDFWRMIWENRVQTIVMLTRIYEGRVSVLLLGVHWGAYTEFIVHLFPSQY